MDALNGLNLVSCDEDSCTGTAVFGTCNGDVWARSKNGVVDAIVVTLDVECYALTYDLLVKKFGKQDTVKHSDTILENGAKIADATSIWFGKDQHLFLDKYQTYNKSTIVLAGPQEEGSL